VSSTTKVSKIPQPLQVTFDPQTRVLGVNIGQTCLALIAVVESVVVGEQIAAWRIVETIPLHASGSIATYKKTVIEHLSIQPKNSKGKSYENYEEELSMALEDELNPRVRVKLCLRGNHEHCGDYTEADSEYFFL
jgi:echinoid protein